MRPCVGGWAGSLGAHVSPPGLVPPMPLPRQQPLQQELWFLGHWHEELSTGLGAGGREMNVTALKDSSDGEGD